MLIIAKWRARSGAAVRSATDTTRLRTHEPGLPVIVPTCIPAQARRAAERPARFRARS